MYGITGQLRRACASVPANIAEGTGRATQKEFSRFCHIAKGSLHELDYHLLLARDLGYLNRESYRPLAQSTSELRRMLTKFIQSL